MESLSSVSTIVRIAQDFAAAVATVGRNNSRCKKLAKRVQGIADLLRELDAVTASTKTDAATQRLLGRLQETLSDSLRLVRSWQDSSCPRNFIAGGRMAEQFDEVDGEIDRCLLDLGVANRLLIARLEKQLHLNLAASTETETVTLRIGMPCDDTADNIKRCIRTIQGVTDVSAAASTKDKFMVTVRSGAVDIPSLLGQVQQLLSRNVETVTPAAAGAGVERYDVKDHDKKANHKSAAVDDRGDKQRQSSGVELKKEKAAPTTMVGVNQQASASYVYLPPFKVALVPVGDDSSMYDAPSPHGFVPYPYGQPGSHPVHAKRQPNLHHVHFKDTGVNKYDSACYIKDSMKGNMPDPVSKGGGEWEEGDKTMATGNVAAIGVPLHTVTAGVPELVPPPSYGHGYWPYAHGRCTGGCCHCNAAGPSDAAAANNYYNYYSQYPDMFSDENPNAYCSIM